MDLHSWRSDDSDVEFRARYVDLEVICPAVDTAHDSAGRGPEGDWWQQAQAPFDAQPVLWLRRCLGGGLGFVLRAGRPEERADVAGPGCCFGH